MTSQEAAEISKRSHRILSKIRHPTQFIAAVPKGWVATHHRGQKLGHSHLKGVTQFWVSWQPCSDCCAVGNQEPFGICVWI